MAMTISETREDDTKASCVKQGKINVTHLSKETTQPWRLLRALPVPWVLFIAGSCSDIYRGPTSCLIVTLLFNVLFLWYFPLFFICNLSLFIVDLLISVLCTQIERSLLSISTRHAPSLLIGYKSVFGLGQTLQSKAFFKNRFVHV